MHFLRLYRLHRAGAFFVTRLKSGVSYYVVESRPVDETAGLRCDQTIRLNSRQGRKDYPDVLRRISYIDPESGQALVFLTNQFELAALMIAQIYRRRWSIELFWRWLKQHLRLRGFFSNDPNGVRVQIWTALCAYLHRAFRSLLSRVGRPLRGRRLVPSAGAARPRAERTAHPRSSPVGARAYSCSFTRMRRYSI